MREIIVGEPMPLIASIEARDGFEVAVSMRGKPDAVVDLAPDIFSFKIYAPLRVNRALFRSVRVIDGGNAITWGLGEIEMPATAIERLGSNGGRSRPINDRPKATGCSTP